MDNTFKKPKGAPFGGFTDDENFCPEYGESLVEGDIRPLIIKDFNEENEE